MNKEEIKKDNNYWKGYIQKQKEAEEICKMCKYRKTYKELKQKEYILDKVTETLKMDKEIFDKCRKKHEMYSPSEERMNTKYHRRRKGKMKKIIITIIIALAITSISFGIINVIVSEGSSETTRFKKVKDERQYFDGYWFYVIYDEETKVEYTFSGNGGLQVLVDEEGKPLIYKEREEK